MNTGLDLLQALDEGRSESIDAAYRREPRAARLLFRELKTRSQGRELHDRLARFTPGLRGSLRVKSQGGALHFLSGLMGILFPEAVPVRDTNAEAQTPEQAYFGPFELRAIQHGCLSIGIPPSPVPLTIFRNGAPYAMIEGRDWRTLELDPGTYRLHQGDDEWEIEVN